jgi:hypothetical protein
VGLGCQPDPAEKCGPSLSILKYLWFLEVKGCAFVSRQPQFDSAMRAFHFLVAILMV